MLTYNIDGVNAIRARSFGQKTQPGDDAPDRFHQLIDVAVGPGGSVITVERLPVGGTRLTRWASGLQQPLWTHLGLEFTGNAAYSTDDPDTIVSIYCDHHTRSIWLIPLAGLNEAGNPRYDWSQAKELVPADQTDVKFFPLMAVRNEQDEIYAFGRSELFPQHPGAGPAWMGGWALAKFDADGKRLWATRLVQHCTGMDYVPGDGGVVVGYFAKAIVYHYNGDGILVGSAGPGAPAAGISGWLDNTASIACNRDPRDGKIDVFAEEDYAHRILWYRFDDSQIHITRQLIEKK